MARTIRLCVSTCMCVYKLMIFSVFCIYVGETISAIHASELFNYLEFLHHIEYRYLYVYILMHECMKVYLSLLRVFLPMEVFLELASVNPVEVVSDRLPSPGHLALQRRQLLNTKYRTNVCQSRDTYSHNTLTSKIDVAPPPPHPKA